MAAFDGALKTFVSRFGEDAVEAALKNYENQKERGKKANAKRQEESNFLSELRNRARTDPKIAELFKAKGIAI